MLVFDKVFMQNSTCCSALREVFLKTVTTKERKRWTLARKAPQGCTQSLHNRVKEGSEESLRKQDTPKTSFMSAGITGKPHTRTLIVSLGNAL